MQLVTQDQVKSKIVKIRNNNLLLDSDVAELYGVETKAINQAVKRNSEKFPDGYIIQLDSSEWHLLKSQNVTSINRGGKVKLPTAFAEKGLYMLATILKSPQAVKTTIAIIDTFAQFKEVTQAVYDLAETTDNSKKVKIFERSTDIVADLLDNELIVSQKETSFKLKLPFLEVTRKVTKVNNNTEVD